MAVLFTRISLKYLLIPIKKIKNPEPRTCKTCDRWRNYDLLQKGLYVSDNKIYLKYQNARGPAALILKIEKMAWR